MFLFIDTTQKITIGLLDQKFQWIDYQFIDLKKSSAIIHKLIHEILEKQNLNLKELTAVFFTAGPGSYTGMRVSEGIKDIFSWQNLKVYSFYHFQVPYFCGVAKGKWISHAFKGELFIYEWEKDESSYKLIKEGDFQYKEEETVYGGHKIENFINLQLTRDVIHSQPEKIFATIHKLGLNEKLFYYRELEDEFKRGK